MLAASCQPTISRLNTSITKLKYKTPSQQRRYVKSQTHKALGRSAEKSRCTRSGLRSARGSVRGPAVFVLPLFLFFLPSLASPRVLAPLVSPQRPSTAAPDSEQPARQ